MFVADVEVRGKEKSDRESISGRDIIPSPWGPVLTLSGERVLFLKPYGYLGSQPGSSFASATLSKVCPARFTNVLGREAGTKVVKVVGTPVIGRAVGRLVPVVGVALTIYDVGSFMYENREAFKYGMRERARLIDEDPTLFK